jgi:hypothetical protein
VTPLTVQNQRLRRENRELLARIKHGLADEVRKITAEQREAEVARKIGEINTRIRESNARDAEGQRTRQRSRP